MKTILALDARELATVLAALRYWRRIGVRAVCPEADISGPNGLWPEEIDTLCERINIEGDGTGMLEALVNCEALLEEAIDVHIYGDDDERDPDGQFIVGIAAVRAIIAKFRPRVEVQMLIGADWENVWGEYDDQNNRSPMTFATEAEAEAEIQEVISEQALDFTRDMFRIVPVASKEDSANV